MSTSRKIIFTLIGLVFWSTGCSPEISETDFYSRHPAVDAGGGEPVLLGEEVVGEYLISLQAAESAHAGSNPVLVTVTDGEGVGVRDATVVVTAATEMNHRIYALPAIDTAARTNEEGQAEQEILLIHQSTGDQLFDVTVTVEDDQTVSRATFNLLSSDTLWVQRVIVGNGADSLYLAWLGTEDIRTGDDSLEFALYRDNGLEFETVNDATFDLYPYMDMGGGDGHSTPYDPPQLVADGRYRGRINFIMSGGWDLTVYLKDGELPATEVLFSGFTVKQ